MKDSLCHILAWHRGWAATLLVHGLLLGAGCGTSTEEPFEASDGGAEDTPSDGAEDLRGELTRDTQDAGLVNLCGGRAPLIHEGIPSDPGTECGCGGFLVCQGIDDLACVGATTRNACGGCEVIAVAIGAACGPCDDGVWS